MKEQEEDFDEDQIAVEAAKDRVLGVAIQHYLDATELNMCGYCTICAAVQAFEAKLAPGHLKMLCDLYLQIEDRGSQSGINE